MLAFLQAHKLNKNNYHLCLHCLKFIVYCSQFEAHLFMTPRSCSIRIGEPIFCTSLMRLHTKATEINVLVAFLSHVNNIE